MPAKKKAAAEFLADFFTPEDLAAGLNVSAKTLDRWAKKGEGPPRTVLGRSIYYRKSAVQEWLCGREGAGPKRTKKRGRQ